MVRQSLRAPRGTRPVFRADAGILPAHAAVDTKKGELAFALRAVLAEWTGLEPATPGVTGRYSNQLNYHSRMVRSAPDATGGC